MRGTSADHVAAVGHRRGRTEHGYQHHDGHDGMHEDEGNRARHLKQPSAYEQTSRVVCVGPSGRLGESSSNGMTPAGEQYADLVWPGAVSRQAEGQGHQRHLVAERRNDPSGEGDVQVPVVTVFSIY